MASTQKIIKRVMPAVVSIVVAQALEEVEKEIPPEVLPFLPFEHSKLKIPDEYLDAHGMVKIGGGSGFLVESSGVVLTNKHVVTGSHVAYTVLTDDNKRFPARVLALDPMDDIAILKIDPPAGKSFPVLPLGDSSKLALGDEVLAFGNPLGMFKNTVSKGIISGLARSIIAAPDPKKPKQEMRGLIQTDAAINPGNSGGPLVDMKGRVIGVNAAIVSNAQSLGFAIPVNAAKRDVLDLKQHGRIKRPLIGFRYLTIDSEMKEKMKLPVEYGALIVGRLPAKRAVTPGSPADKAGLREKDIILEIGGKKLTPEWTVLDVLESKEVGDMVEMKVLRGTVTFETRVKLAERK